MLKKNTTKGTSVNELIVNQNGTTLLEHSKLVSIVATEIAKQTLSSSEESIIENVRISALLHSIGKCCKVFQKDIKNPPKKERKVKFLYNEIGWAFITKYISSKSEFILDCIYWTNGINSKSVSVYNNNNILDTIDKDDKDVMLDFLKEILQPTYKYHPNDIKSDSPIYYSGNAKDIVTNAEKTFIRTCVTSADRLVSSLEINTFKELLYTQDISEINRLINNLTKRHFYNDPSFKLCFDEYDSKRLEIQKKIAENCEKTTIVNAPAGFGKSLLTVLWNLLYSSKKLIIVCPTNVISESTYLNTLKELQTLGIGDKVSIELYLTGKTKKTNRVNKENFIEFNSDIIVTNIDNFLSPSINSNNAERLFFINNCDVVFDEYHKLLCKEALFACFINIMNTRHRFTESRTLLVSATPVKINKLWENGLTKTKILPDENSHYPAAHKGKYKRNTFIVECIDDIKIKSKSSSLVILNSIGNSQIIHNKINSAKLVHSKFSPSDKDIIFSHIYKFFDKNASRSLNKTNITATHVIQESLDISFANIHESVLSPNSSWQRMGKCNRFGDQSNIPEINTYKILKSGGENKMKEILYTKDLSDEWFDYLSKYNGKTYDLDKWYTIYNEFNKINSKEIDKYSESCFEESMRYFSKIFPRHYSKVTNSDKKMKAGANKLRSIGSEIFFICKVHNSNKYSEMFSDSNRGNLFNYNENEKTPTRIVKTRKEIMKIDDRFDYNIKQWNQSVIREEAKNSDTPYIRFDVVYNTEYGIIDKELLKEFKDKNNN